METGKTKWICVQLGAREHYAIPRVLHRMGRLEVLFTEIWAGPLLRRLAFGPLRPLATRHHPDLSRAHVVAWTWRTLFHRNTETLKYRPTETPKHRSTGPYARFVRDGHSFSEQVRNHLTRHNTDVRGKVIFSYDTTALELFQWAKAQGAICVLGQMDPGRVEYDLVQEESARWPGWAKHRNTETPVSGHGSEIGNRKSDIVNPDVDAYFQRREEEWQLADRIIVNSRWSLDALVQQGVPPEKIKILPLAYELDTARQTAENKSEFQVSGFSVSAFEKAPSSIFHPPSSPPKRALRVLWLGQVNLRKGIQYLIEAARLLNQNPVAAGVSRLQSTRNQTPVAAGVSQLQPAQNQTPVAADVSRLQSTSPPPQIQFDIVGPIGISEAALKLAPATVRFHGPVSRDRAAEWYERSDVFVLPTLSDGFAITQIEAMAHGLPVIATPNCGAVVTDGVDGAIVPARDAAALAQAIRRYLTEPERLQSQRTAAFAKAKQFSLANLAANLVALEAELTKHF